MKKMFSLTLLLSPYSIPHCHSFLFSALPFLCAAYTVTLTFVRLTTDVHLMKALMEKTKHLSKESTKKRTANGANETVEKRIIKVGVAAAVVATRQQNQ